MKTRTLHRLLTLITLIGISTMMVLAEQVTKGKITIQYDPMADGGIKVINVWNKSDKRIELKVDGKPITVNANSSAQLNQYASKHVRYDFIPAGGGDLLWKLSPKKEPIAEESPAAPAVASDEKGKIEGKKEERKAAGVKEGKRSNKLSSGSSIGYLDRLNQDEFFGIDAISAYTQKVDALCRAIDSAKNKSQFIIDNDVKLFLQNSENEIDERKVNLASIAQDIVSSSNIDAASRASTLSLIVETLSNRLVTRENAHNRLSAIVANVDDNNDIVSHSIDESIVNYRVICAIILLLIILTIVTVRRKKKNQSNGSRSAAQSPSYNGTSSSDPAIVVRRRTTSILKKQCVDDVIDNPMYMVISTSDFTPDSAVRRIYIKNSCIKDVYNLYAENLRNTENPKEDGCMVLGRWVHDESTHTYDISLEEVVFPGDDAIFKEYELNFGGKIKLRIAERLRKLRRDTNLQYDLVCWIHSHPGLGVFFSNSDDNVQMQLKHSQHPNFLIAFVVDILTSSQEMGIFTFRKDGSMNSKSDITKMYSLEEMYKWALQSERSTFSHDNYFNIVDNAKLKLPECKGVELNNSSIIDLSQIVIEPETGIVGWAVGTTVENKGNMEYVVSSIVRNSAKPGTGVIGCLISMTHMSFPTIQRLIARDSVNLSFVMVYSSKQMSLTTIPVINGELLSDEQFYGDVNIDDLKIWTRRKR